MDIPFSASVVEEIAIPYLDVQVCFNFFVCSAMLYQLPVGYHEDGAQKTFYFYVDRDLTVHHSPSKFSKE